MGQHGLLLTIFKEACLTSDLVISQWRGHAPGAHYERKVHEVPPKISLVLWNKVQS